MRGGSDRRRSRARSITCMGLICAAALLGSVLRAPAAAAGGGSAGATGSGDEIVSSILRAAEARRRGRTPTAEAPCHRRKLTDEQVVFLVHVLASMPELEGSGFQEALDQYMEASLLLEPTGPPEGGDGEGAGVDEGAGDDGAAGGDGASGGDVGRAQTTVTVRSFYMTVLMCNGVARSMDVRSAPVGEAARGAVLARGVREIRTLPGPELRISPPVGPLGGSAGSRPGRTALVGEPVFVGVSRPEPVRGELRLDGTVVAVEAEPRSVRVFDGQFADDVGNTIDCPFGPGFDGSPDAPTVASQAEGSCVLTYQRPTGGTRRSAWIGYALVEWDAEYRLDGGAPRSIEGLFSFTPFEMRVAELEAVLEG